MIQTLKINDWWRASSCASSRGIIVTTPTNHPEDSQELWMRPFKHGTNDNWIGNLDLYLSNTVTSYNSHKALSSCKFLQMRMLCPERKGVNAHFENASAGELTILSHPNFVQRQRSIACRPGESDSIVSVTKNKRKRLSKWPIRKGEVAVLSHTCDKIESVYQRIVGKIH